MAKHIIKGGLEPIVADRSEKGNMKSNSNMPRGFPSRPEKAKSVAAKVKENLILKNRRSY